MRDAGDVPGAQNDLLPGRLVGRDSELGMLTSAWEETRSGVGRSVMISGEPGVGKSRLLCSLEEQLDGEEHRWLALRCSRWR